MTDFISKFITAVVNVGINPKNTGDIVAADRFRRIAQITDKKGKKSISYWLKIEHDFAYGYAFDFKTGIFKRFNSANDDKNLTKADIQRINSLLKVRKAEQEVAEKERWAKIANRAVVKMNQSSSVGTTPYLDKKGLPLLSARIYGNRNLFIPIFESNKGTLELISWQIIEADGTKQFPFGGKQAGGMHIIGQIDPRLPIPICEGWATGASIYLATGQIQGVVVAFSAGNLPAVAKAIREIYNAPIIIAADNDKSGTGIKAAHKCQKAVSDISIVMPKEIGHDFNDLPLEVVGGYFKKYYPALELGGGGGDQSNDPSVQPLNSPAKAPIIDWQDNLIRDGKNNLVGTSLQNTILYLMHHHELAGCFVFDEFKQDSMVVKCPPWEESEKFKPQSVDDIVITKAAASLERYGITATIEKTDKAIAVVAYENRFHSARSYFKTLEWDKKERLTTFCQDHFGTKQESVSYLSFVFKKWLTAAVKRIMEPGCKFDHVLILESQQQGLYKSTFLKTLATFNGECYHTEDVPITDLSNKDTTIKMQGNLIIELAELSGFSKKDDNEIKTWIQKEKDEVRLPFARKSVIYPRQFVFAATTNNYDYLKDPTGNRRYWPVTVECPIDIKAVNEIKDQLWAEAVYWYNEALYIGPTPEEELLADKERGKRLMTDVWEDKVINIISKLGLSEFKTSHIVDEMDLRTNERSEAAARRVSGILKQNGYKNTPIWDSKLNKTVRVWNKL